VVCQASKYNFWRRTTCSLSCRAVLVRETRVRTPEKRATWVSNISKARKKTLEKGGGGFFNKSYYYYNEHEKKVETLQSSYEVRVAFSLDTNGVRWQRPDPIIWTDARGGTHNYYPDFLLPDYNVYLDPKNTHVAKKDKNKIKRVRQQNQIQLLVLNKMELNWSKIKNKIEKLQEV